jgi:hypothetical protein
MSELFKGVGVEVDILNSDNFLKIAETLTRMGIPSVKSDKNTLYQSCHILHKRDTKGDSKYAIVHFKELFQLDGKQTNIDEEDIQRRNSIVQRLAQWNLVKVIETEKVSDSVLKQSFKIIKHTEKSDWVLLSKYQIGTKKEV